MTRDDKDNNEEPGRSRVAGAIVALICAIPLVSTIAYGAVDWLALGILFAVAGVVWILWLVDSLLSGEFRFSSDAIQLPLVGLIVIAGVQLLPLAGADRGAEMLTVAAARTLTMDPYATRFFLIQLVIYLFFFSAALVYVPGVKRPKTIAVLLVSFGCLLSFFGILQRLSMPEAIYGLRPTPQAIPFGPFVNQHHFAALMHMLSGVAVAMLLGTGVRREAKFLVGFAAGIMGMAIIFTGSRGGLISYLSVVIFAAGASFVRVRRRGREDTYDQRNRNLLVSIAAGLLVLLVAGSVLLLGGEDSLLRGVGLHMADGDVTSGRLHFWSVAWQVFLGNPILGTGLNSFGVAFTQFDTWNGFFRVEQAHNDYLQMLADAGIIGFACIAVFIFLLLKKGITAIREQKDGLHRSIVSGALAGCIGTMVHSFFDFPLRTPANGFFFLLLVVLVLGTKSPGNRQRARAA